MATRNFGRDALRAVLQAEIAENRANVALANLDMDTYRDQVGRNQWHIQRAIMYSNMALLVRMGGLRAHRTDADA